MIGFLGNTGDAQTTPYHLHFEIHPVSLLYLDYDGAVDPTTYLDAWRKLEDVELPGRRRLGAVRARRLRRRSLERSCSRSPTSRRRTGSTRRSLQARAGRDPARAASSRRRRRRSEPVALEPKSPPKSSPPPVDEVLQPAARLGAGDRVEEDAERDARRPCSDGRVPPWPLLALETQRSVLQVLDRLAQVLVQLLVEHLAGRLVDALRCRSGPRRPSARRRTRSGRRRAASSSPSARSTNGFTFRPCRPRPCPSSWPCSAVSFRLLWSRAPLAGTRCSANGQLRAERAACRSRSTARGRRGLRRRAVERGGEHLLDRVGEDELELVARLLRQLVEVGLVLARQDHALQPGALRPRAPSRGRRRSAAPGR